jgi:hypothetical protein
VIDGGVAAELRWIIGRPVDKAVDWVEMRSGVINESEMHDAALNRVFWLGGVGISLALKSPALVFY